MSTRTMRQVAGHRELAARLEGLTATARSPDGGIAVTVRPPGMLTGLTLTDAALRRGTNELAGLIVATAGRAQARLARRIRGHVAQQLAGQYAVVEQTGAAP